MTYFRFFYFLTFLEVDKAPTAESAKEDPQVEGTGGKIDASELLK